MQNKTIDLAPTWGETGRILQRSNNIRMQPGLQSQYNKAFAMAEALRTIWGTLTPEQVKAATETINKELG